MSGLATTVESPAVQFLIVGKSGGIGCFSLQDNYWDLWTTSGFLCLICVLLGCRLGPALLACSKCRLTTDSLMGLPEQ